jgi:GT2 family glycosyltransferase
MQTSSSRSPIAAVVVTCNRCIFLKRCIEALTHQARRLDEFMVIGHASTDDTQEMLQQKFDGQITYVRM